MGSTPSHLIFLRLNERSRTYVIRSGLGRRGKTRDGERSERMEGVVEDMLGMRRSWRTDLQDSHARQTRLRWSWTGLRPMSGGSWSSTRFFLGGCCIVIDVVGRVVGRGLSVESGDGFVSVVMVEGQREYI